MALGKGSVSNSICDTVGLVRVFINDSVFDFPDDANGTFTGDRQKTRQKTERARE